MLAEPRVLIVDDDDSNLELLAQGFARAKYSLLCARTRQEALQNLEDFRCDAMVINGAMECMNTLEFLREIKAMPDYAELPIIVEVSSDTPRELMAAMKMGASCYGRPYDVDVVVNAVGRVLNRDANVH
jgi:CheY-like chemotaxis protein